MSVSSAAHAQTSEDAAAGAIDEIVVTALKSGQALEKAPVSVSVVTGEELRNLQVENVSQITVRTPSVVYNTAQGSAQIFIRGVGSSFSLAGAESAVATYIDGSYIQRQFGADVGVFDVSSVQVLRGPQSVLYGRNATGGAVVIETNKPTHDTEGYVEGTGGNLGSYRVEGVVNTPLSDTLALRIAGAVWGRNNWIKNLGDGGDMGGSDAKYIRGKLRWEPNDRLDMVLTVEHSSVGENGYALHRVEDAPCLACVFYGLSNQGTGYYEVSTNDRNSPLPGGERDYILNTKITNIALNAQYQTDNFDVTSVTSYRRTSVFPWSDNDLSTAPMFYSYVAQTGPTFNQDLYVQTKFDGPLNVLAGVYYQRERQTQVTRFAGGYWDGFLGVAGSMPSARLKAPVDSISLYGDATFDITPELRLTAGLRWSSDKKRQDNYNDAQGALLAGGLTEYHSKRTYSYVTPRAVISYETGNNYYYFSYAEGVRSGFFTSPSFAPVPALEPERLKNFEAGAKNSFLDGRLKTALTVFYGTFENMIVQFNNPAGGGISAQNAAKAELYGGELEVTYNAGRAFQISAGASYLHNEFTDYQNAAVFTPGPNGYYVPITQDLSGHTVPRAPEFTGFVSLNYNHEFDNGWAMQANINANYSTSFDFTAGAGGTARRDRQDAYEQVNGQLKVTLPGDRVYMKAYVKNLTDAKYKLYAATDDFGSQYAPGMPRTYGVGLGVRF
ncbi:TonB-dependent receptor [Sphingobium sp. MI1205]|uniref:TonB-dependent receptor n=1 Tax=Sphingobium sp. MI1205 TaxID=407020 RepID=UPI001314E98A|nr:TonB-dependent receptor [Sphingobium sp. MI1205]